MPGVLAWGYYPTDKIWLPIQVDANGCVKADMSAINLNDLADVSVAAPTDGYVLYWDAATSLWKCKAIPAAAWAAITGKPTSPSLEELATEHDAAGLHAGMVLDNIGDVSVPTPTDGYVLYWDAATSLWKCKAAPAGTWATLTGKPDSPSLEELATEHDADGTHGAITPTSCGLKTTHEAATTGVHGVGANYIAAALAASHVVQAFSKGWIVNKLLKGAGVNAAPTEIGGLEVVFHTLITETTPSVTISGLDGNTDNFYILLVHFVNAYNGAVSLFNKINNDGVYTNYWRQYLAVSNTSISALRDQYPRGFQAGYAAAINHTSWQLGFIQARSGTFRQQWSLYGYGTATTPTFVAAFMTWTNTADNLTSMVLQCFSANWVTGIGAGSHFTLLKLAY